MVVQRIAPLRDAAPLRPPVCSGVVLVLGRGLVLVVEVATFGHLHGLF